MPTALTEPLRLLDRGFILGERLLKKRGIRGFGEFHKSFRRAPCFEQLPRKVAPSVGSHHEVDGSEALFVGGAEVAVGLVDLADELGGEVALGEDVWFVVIGVGEDGIIDNCDPEAGIFERFSLEVRDADLEIRRLTGLIAWLIGEDLDLDLLVEMSKHQTLGHWGAIGCIKQRQTHDPSFLRGQWQFEMLCALFEGVALVSDDLFMLHRHHNDLTGLLRFDKDLEIGVLGLPIVHKPHRQIDVAPSGGQGVSFGQSDGLGDS